MSCFWYGLLDVARVLGESVGKGGGMAYSSFEDLEVWKEGVRIATRVYGVMKGCRDFGLKDQMTRAAVSISSNIAEGAERDSQREFARFCILLRDLRRSCEHRCTSPMQLVCCPRKII